MYHVNNGGSFVYDVMSLLSELENIVVLNRMEHKPDYTTQKDEYAIINNPQKAIFIGEGTNRLVFKSNVSELPLQQLGLGNGNYVYKVPWQLKIGSEDNVREVLVPVYIENNKAMDVSLQYLNSIVPKSWLLRSAGINNIIIQEEVLTHETMSRFQNELNKEEAWKNYVMNSPNLTEQYSKLMTALDKHFVMADMSLSMTASNFGLKMNSREEILVPLDLGHLIPKYGKSVRCPACGKPMVYTHYADQEIINTNDIGLKNKVIALGSFYRCSDIECTVTNSSNSASKSLIPDNRMFTIFLKAIQNDEELKSIEPLLKEI